MASRSLAYRMKQAIGGIWPRWGGTDHDSRWTQVLPGARFDYQAAAGDVWSNATVAIALAWMGDRVHRPIQRVSRIERRTGLYRPLDRHPLVDLWERPNPHDTRRSLEGGVALSLRLDGNAYALKVRDGASRVAELWWLPHHWVEPCWPSDGSAFISHYEATVDGRPHRIDASDIIHFRMGRDPRNPRKGLSAPKACLREVATDNEVATYTASLLRNSAVPALAVIPKGDQLRPTAEDAERIRERIQDLTAGESRGRSLVLGGPYDVVTVGYSPEQLTLDRLPQLALAKLGAAMGVPLMAMGLPDPGKTYSNISQALRVAWGTVRSTQDAVAEGLRWGLLAELGSDPYSHVVEYDYGQIDELQEDQKVRSDRVCNEWKLGIRKLNEARDELGLEPDDDGDRYHPGTGEQSDDAPDLPALPTDEPPPRVPPKPEPDDDDDAGKGTKSLDGSEGEQCPPFGTKDGAPTGDEAENTFGLPDGLPISKELRRWFRRQLKSILGTLPEIGEGIPTDFPPLTDYDDPMASAMTPLISAYWDESGRRVRERLGLDPDEWQVTDPHLREKISTAAYDFCAATNATTSKALADALAELRASLAVGQVDEGETLVQLRKRVEAVFDGAETWRAQRIAASEASRAVHAAELESAAASGVVAGVEWLLSGDACPLCQKVASEAKRVPLGRPFAIVGDHPVYSAIRHPPLHPGCQCSLIEILKPEYGGPENPGWAQTLDQPKASER